MIKPPSAVFIVLQGVGGGAGRTAEPCGERFRIQVSRVSKWPVTATCLRKETEDNGVVGKIKPGR